MGAKERPNSNEIRGKEVEHIAQNQRNILGLQEDPWAMYHPMEESRFGVIPAISGVNGSREQWSQERVKKE